MSTERDTQLLSIGKQCSHPSCLLVDFLPFKCQHCEDSFCQEHFMVSAHHCPKYDENKHNRVAPDCPFCHTPVAVRPNQDPNARMEEHFNNECSVMTGKTGKARSMPVCARGKCKKVLFQPIRCDSCKDQFCPAHRFPTDHNCTPVASSTAKPGVANPFANINTKNLNSKASAAGAATMGAIKKTMASTATATAAKPKPTPAVKAEPPKSSAPSSSSNPFSKTDRFFISPPPTTPNAANNDVTHTGDSSTTTTTTSSTTGTATHKPVLIPAAIIDYNAFVPRPIFATA